MHCNPSTPSTSSTSCVASPVLPSLPTTPQATRSASGARPPSLPVFSTPRHVAVPASCQPSPLFSSGRRAFTFEQEAMLEQRLGDSLASMGCLSITPQPPDHPRPTLQELLPMPPRASSGAQPLEHVALDVSVSGEEALRLLRANHAELSSCTSPQAVAVWDDSSPSSPCSVVRHHSTTTMWGTAGLASPLSTACALPRGLVNVLVFHPAASGSVHNADDDDSTAPPGSSADASVATDVSGSVFSDRRSLLYHQHYNSSSSLHTSALGMGTIAGSPMPSSKGVLQPPLATPRWAACKPTQTSANASPSASHGLAALVLDSGVTAAA